LELAEIGKKIEEYSHMVVWEQSFIDQSNAMPHRANLGRFGDYGLIAPCNYLGLRGSAGSAITLSDKPPNLNRRPLAAAGRLDLTAINSAATVAAWWRRRFGWSDDWQNLLTQRFGLRTAYLPPKKSPGGHSLKA
jgi:hypothetical protein